MKLKYYNSDLTIRPGKPTKVLAVQSKYPKMDKFINKHRESIDRVGLVLSMYSVYDIVFRITITLI